MHAKHGKAFDKILFSNGGKIENMTVETTYPVTVQYSGVNILGQL